MATVIVIEKGRSLEDVVKALVSYKPNVKILRAHNYGEAMEYIRQSPKTMLIDEEVELSFEICRQVRFSFELYEAHVTYFVKNRKSIDPTSTYVDQWYVKGHYNPQKVVESIKDRLN